MRAFGALNNYILCSLLSAAGDVSLIVKDLAGCIEAMQVHPPAARIAESAANTCKE